MRVSTKINASAPRRGDETGAFLVERRRDASRAKRRRAKNEWAKGRTRTMSARRRTPKSEKVELQMTSMIDVVFLL
ncbi:MAG: hypothetical protein IJ387_11260, partial [Thermoguttaceae bacterium]|nr:hypothetical protein [Thermoguttaceae bacterium]